ncbi:MAG: hypothetical protein QF822_01935 [Candidatus Poseidoniia archaeon]|nr:hypothetical protein [Euryarchaeota archaeon]MDP6489655.1 hypothetical protein [Candidatus Poseidoniia archaeon]MDP6533969.1 hypothetical protein [Candidatus Poseidoniia archaeon]
MTGAERELGPFRLPSLRWTGIFVLLTLLSLDVWAWDSKAVIGDWLPVWVFHLLVLQFTLAFALWRFAQEWKP